MDFEAGFLCNQKYGAKHMNRVIRSLVTKGIVDYPFSDAENDIGAVNLNGFVQFLSEGGVVPETAKSLMVEQTSSGYKLNPGMGFLSNGVYIFVENSQTFSASAGDKIYFMHDNITDTVKFKCDSSYPSGNAYLPLAEILEDGSVKNVRTYARAKLPGMASDYNRSKKITVGTLLNFEKNDSGYENDYFSECEIDLGGNNYKYLLIFRKDYKLLVDFENLTYSALGYFDYDEYHVKEGNFTIGSEADTDGQDGIWYDPPSYSGRWYLHISEISDSGLMKMAIWKYTSTYPHSYYWEDTFYLF